MTEARPTREDSPTPEDRRSAFLLLGVAAVFVGVAVFAGIAVTPWLFLVGLTAIPTVLAAVRTLRAPR